MRAVVAASAADPFHADLISAHLAYFLFMDHALQLKPSGNPETRCIGTDRRSARRDRSRQDSSRFRDQIFPVFLCHPCTASARADAAGKADLIGIDIADACHEALIEQ